MPTLAARKSVGFRTKVTISQSYLRSTYYTVYIQGYKRKHEKYHLTEICVLHMHASWASSIAMFASHHSTRLPYRQSGQQRTKATGWPPFLRASMNEANASLASSSVVLYSSTFNLGNSSIGGSVSSDRRQRDS